MIAIRIKVPESAEFYDESDMFTLMQYTQETAEKHAFAAKQIALYFETNNVRFSKEKSVPFQVEVLYFPLEQEIEYSTIIQMMIFTDKAIRDGLEPKTDIERMRELIKLHDRFSKMANILSTKAAEIKYDITKLLETHNEIYL